VISCFKLFSTVFERLKPRLRVFSTSSLSKYNTTFLLFFILHSHPSGCKGEVLCYKFGDLMFLPDLERKMKLKDNRISIGNIISLVSSYLLCGKSWV
jgi:hypothetical protein